MLIVLLALVACAQPQPITTAPRTGAESPFARRTSTVVPGNTSVVNVTDNPRNPFATAEVRSTQIGMPATFTPSIQANVETDTALPTIPATVVASNTPQPTPTATSSVIISPSTPTAITNEQRWRLQQNNREVLIPPRMYTIRGQTALLWFDPLTSQILEIGSVSGSIPVQALFVFRSENRAALEVPYRINGDFGLTSISDVVIERMRKAGYTETVETFIFFADGIEAQN